MACLLFSLFDLLLNKISVRDTAHYLLYFN